MVVSTGSQLGLPPLRGNPFDLRPIERIRANELVGRENILMAWREHIHSQSPRMILLVGQSGSGKTSLINAISSQTSNYFVGQYWHNDDPMRRVLSEISVHFGGHESPITMNRTIEQTIETLDAKTGPLPLIAFDYPPTTDVTNFLSLIIPIMKRFRAFVVVSLIDSKLPSLEETIKGQFDSIVELGPLSKPQLQMLSDSRLLRSAREKWRIAPNVLDSLHSITGGNPGDVISTLRDLVDEERGLGSDGALERLLAWSKTRKQEPLNTNPISASDQFVTQKIDEVPIGIENDPPGSHEGWEEPADPVEHEGWEEPADPVEHEGWEEPADPVEHEGWEEPGFMGDEKTELKPFNIPSSVNQKTTIESNQGQANLEEKEDQKAKSGEKITDMLNEKGKNMSHLTKMPYTPPKMQESGFLGLRGRSKITSDSMPTGPFDEEIEPNNNTPPIFQKNISTATSNLAKNYEQNIERLSKSDETKVFSSEGELWTVESEMETTLMAGGGIDQLNPNIILPDNETIQEKYEEKIDFFTEPPPTPLQISPKWESEGSVDHNHLNSLSEAESLIVSISKDREVSPSDPEIQARLEVGRPRLSQIFNSLRRSGILSVRKRGRSRLFKLSEQASDLI